MAGSGWESGPVGPRQRGAHVAAAPQLAGDPATEPHAGQVEDDHRRALEGE